MPRTPAQLSARAFLAAYRQTGDVTAAAAAANIDRSNHYQWLRNSPGYKRAFERCREQLGDALEALAIKRATEGVLEPVFYQGLKVGAVRRFDVGREMFLLRGLKRDVYGAKLEAEVKLTGELGIVDRLRAARKRLNEHASTSDPGQQ